MSSSAENVAQYLAELPEERKAPMEKLREVILKNIPAGFSEGIGYGMIGYVVPFSKYPDGYHCNPKQALPFISLASQKNNISLHHLGIYANPELLAWFQEEYPKHCKTKLDMGKGCIRFKKPENIPYELVGELVSKISVDQWIEMYESNFKK